MDGEERQVVVFKIGNETFGIDIHEVREIIRMEDITGVPNSPAYIKGLINLRGGLIVVIDLAMKLGLASKEKDKHSRIMVIEVEDTAVGMVVDSASDVLRLTRENMQEAPAVITQKINGNYIQTVGVLKDRMLILLDLAELMKEDIPHIKKAMEAETTQETASA